MAGQASIPVPCWRPEGAEAAFAVLSVPLSAEPLLIVKRGGWLSLWTEDARNQSFSEVIELLPQRVFVSPLGGLYLAANFVFLKVRLLPFIDFSYRMID